MTSMQIHVTPRPDGRWAVKKKGNKKASRVFKSKRKAMKKARKMAKRMASRNKLVELVPHKRNGRIQQSKRSSYGGTNPHPPRG